jgi:signal transduction histidine kinase
MTDAFNIIISLLEVLNYTAFIVYFFDCSNIRKWIAGTACYIILCFISLFLANSIATGYISFLIIAVSFLFVKFNSGRDIPSSMMIALFPDFITALINSLILIFASYLLYGTVNFNDLMNSYGVFIIILSKCIQIILFFIAAQYVKKILQKLHTIEMYMTDLMIIISMITIDSVEGLLYLGQYSSFYLSAVIISQALLTFLLIAVIRNIVCRNEEESRNEMNRQLLKSQSKSISNMIASEKELRELRHTVQHLLSSLPKNIHYDCDTVQLQKELSSISIPVTTKYPVLNTIVNIKREQAAEKGIQMILNLNIVTLPQIEDDDMYVLLVNLFDNAIDHIGAEKIINVTVRSIHGSFFIHTENSVDCYILDKNKKIPSSNNNLHGFGTRTIEAIVKKYKGLLKYDENNYNFSVRILFPFDNTEAKDSLFQS